MRIKTAKLLPAVLSGILAVSPLCNYSIKADNNSGLSTVYTGDEILNYAKKTYDDWTYQDVDTCTGFMAHVFYEDLKVPVGMDIVGPRRFVGYGWEPYNGYLTEYNPDEMMAVAEQKVANGSAMKVYDGPSSGAKNSKIPLRNGDIVITSRNEVGQAYGHVAMIEVRDDGSIGWFGAHNTYENPKEDVSFMAFGDGGKFDKKKDGDSPNTFSGMIHVYRVVDFEKPEYHDDVDTSKEVTYSLAVKETDKETGEPVDGVEYIFKSGDTSETIKTDTQGIARKSITNRFDVNKADYRYITNYDKLSKEDKARVDEEKVYHSYEEAQAEADKQLMQQAVSSPVDFSHYTVTRKNSGDEDIVLSTKKTDAKTNTRVIHLEEEDARMTRKSVKIVGFAKGAKCAIYDSSETLVEEFVTGDLGQGTAGYIARNLQENTTYKVRELQEPQGYIKSEDITFTVGEKDNTVFLKEQPIMATLKIEATGKAFEKYEDGLPVYTDKVLKDVSYTVFAKEDIKTGTKVVYTHGQEVGTFKGDISNLPMGHYYFVVSDAPKGYATDGTRYDFTVEDGTVADPVYEMEVKVTTQVVTLDVEGIAKKDDAVTVYRVSDKQKLYVAKVDDKERVVVTQGMPVGDYYLTVNNTDKKHKFTIKGEDSSISTYTKRVSNTKKDNIHKSIKISLTDILNDDIKLENVNFALSDTENFDKVMKEARTNSNGQAEFNNLDFGTYYIKQTSLTDDYTISDQIYRVTISENVPEVMVKVRNRKTEAIIESKDLGGMLSVKGLNIVMEAKDGKIIDEWESDKLAHIVNGLKEGETYKIYATNTVKGYDEPAEVEFVMKDGITVILKSKEEDENAIENIASLFATWQLLLIGGISLTCAIYGREYVKNRKSEVIKF